MSEFAACPAFSISADQPVFQFLGSPERLLVAGPQSGGKFALFQSSGERGHTAPRQRHASETFIVLDGELVFQAGRRPRTGRALTTLAAGHGIDITSPALTLDDCEQQLG